MLRKSRLRAPRPQGAVGLWKVAPLFGRLVALAGSADTGPGLRRAAIDGLARFGDRASRQEIDRLAAPEAPAAAQPWAIAALASLDPRAGARRAGLARRVAGGRSR